MKIAITGGTGFVGRHLANRLVEAGHDVVAIGRGDRPENLDARVRVMAADIVDAEALVKAFAGCDAVVHAAGINRQIGDQTYQKVHVQGTSATVRAARAAGVRRIAIVSFLRARPDGPDEYHRSKWHAEEIVRESGLAWTVLKCGVIYGRGDHLLDHVSRAVFSVPVFGLVGLRPRTLRPVAVDDVCRVLGAAATGDPRFADRTVSVLGPDELTLGALVRRVARVIDSGVLVVPLPVAASLLLARLTEAVMTVPLLAVAQARILAEGVTIPAPAADMLPEDLLPTTHFDENAIRQGLPERRRFGRADLRPCRLLGNAPGSAPT